MSDDSSQSDQHGREISDLVGVKLTAALAVWFIAVLVAFFLVGVVVGVILIFVGLVGFGWYAVSAVRRADTTN